MKFFHRIAGAKFWMPDGKEISFAGGEFDTSLLHESVRGAVELELQKVANVPSSMIFTTETPVVSREERAAVSEITAAATVAFDTVHKIQGNPETVPMPMAPTQTQPLSSGVTGKGDPLAERLAAAKAAVNNGGGHVSKGVVSSGVALNAAKQSTST